MKAFGGVEAPSNIIPNRWSDFDFYVEQWHTMKTYKEMAQSTELNAQDIGYITTKGRMCLGVVMVYIGEISIMALLKKRLIKENA